MIDVKPTDDWTFEVTVTGRRTTTHTVEVDPSYYRQLTGSRVPPKALVEKSFEFLLEREPNTSILERFDLSVISRYFPEYERTIPKLLA